MTEATNNPDDNSILLRVEKMSQLTDDGISSDTKTCFGFPWQIRANRDEAEGLKIYLFTYNEENSNVWFCDASMEVLLINQNEGGEDHKIQSVIHRYTPETCTAGVYVTLEKSPLFEDSSMGFIKGETIIVEVRITVHSRPGSKFRKKVEYDMFSPSPKSDGILIVRGKKVYVSKQFLATQSAFFDKLFYGKFKEAQEEESEIQDIVLDEFEVLLKMLYRTGEPFSDTNIEFILKLADRFEMLSILDDAERFMISSTVPVIHTKLSLADQYNLFVLQDHLFSKYTAELIRELHKSPDYSLLKEETKDILFKKYIEFTSK